MLLHVLRLVAVVGAPLNGDGTNFRVAGACGSLYNEAVVHLVHGISIGILAVAAEDPVDCQVGITADGGGEVGVVLQCQTEVADGIRRIGSLCHGAQHHDVQHRIQVGASCAVQNLCQMAGLDVGEHRHIHAQTQEDLFQIFDLLRRGLVVDTIDKRQVLFPCHLCGSFVCQQHHLLDDALALSTLPCNHVHADILIVDDERTLGSLQLRRTTALPLPQTDVAQLVHQRNHVDDILILVQQLLRSRAVQNLIDLAVYALDGGADDRLAELVLHDLAVFVQLHECGERQTVFAGVQRADAVGQAGGQHGNDVIRIVDAGATVQRLGVQRGVRADIVGYVGDVYAQLVAGGCLFQRNCVVQILGVCAVNGEDGGAAQIQTLFIFLLRNGCVCQLFSLGNDLLRKRHVYAADGNDCLRTDAGTGGNAEAIDDLDLVLCVALSAVYDLCQHLFALVIDDAVLALNLDGSLGHGVRTEHQSAVVVDDDTGQLAVRLLQNGEHLALRLSAAGGNVADEHTVFGHCALQELSGNKDILRTLFLRPCEAKGTVQANDGCREISHVGGGNISPPALADGTLVAQLVDGLPEIGSAAPVGAAFCRKITVAQGSAPVFLETCHNLLAVAFDALSASELCICHKYKSFPPPIAASLFSFSFSFSQIFLGIGKKTSCASVSLLHRRITPKTQDRISIAYFVSSGITISMNRISTKNTIENQNVTFLRRASLVRPRFLS